MKLNFALLLLCIFSVAAIPAVAQHGKSQPPQTIMERSYRGPHDAPLLRNMGLRSPRLRRMNLRKLTRFRMITVQPQHSSSKRKTGTAARVAESVHLNNLGAAYMNQQQFARALNLFRRAAALNTKLEIAKTNKGIALANLQKYGAATTIFTALARKDHGNAHAWYMLGL